MNLETQRHFREYVKNFYKWLRLIQKVNDFMKDQKQIDITEIKQLKEINQIRVEWDEQQQILQKEVYG